MDVERLRQMTKEAVERGGKKREKKLEEEKREENRKRREEELKAQMIIEQIPYRAETEAKVGRNHAIIMEIGRDYDRPRDDNNWNRCDYRWLKNAAVIVWNYCVGAGLNPTLEAWHDGVGIKSGFNIVVRW